MVMDVVQIDKSCNKSFLAKKNRAEREWHRLRGRCNSFWCCNREGFIRKNLKIRRLFSKWS